MKQITRYIQVLSTLLLLLSACSKSDVVEVSPAEEKIRFELFTRNGSYGLPVSRVGGNENVVDKRPWILVFRGSGKDAVFAEMVQADDFGGRIYVYLTEQSEPCLLLVLANPPDRIYTGIGELVFSGENVSAYLEGKDLEFAALNLLTLPLTNPRISVPYVGQNLPMSDLVSVSKIASNVTIPQVNLDRVVGKMIVKNTDSNFELKGVTVVMNVAKQTPLYNLDNTLKQNIGAANLTEYRADASYTSDIVAAESLDGGQSTGSNPLYLYETHTTSNDTYLVIRGVYEGEEFFYKMAIVDSDRDVLNVTRNTEYTFTITSAKGRGFSSVADAKASASSNTNLDYVLLVRDSYSYEIMENNDYYLGVTNSHFEVYAPAGTTDKYTAFTLVTDCDVSFPNYRTVKSLTTGLKIVSPADGLIPVSTTVPYNVEVEMAAGFTTGQIEVHLGNLKKIITVRRQDRLAFVASAISTFIDGGYYVSAQVEDYVNHQWLQLAPGDGIVRGDPDYIFVDDGKITLTVGRNNSGVRSGTVYVSTGGKGGNTQRIKVHVTQANISQN